MGRDPYLDSLRAIAILMVLVHHVVQQWPESLPWLVRYTHYGAAGVDLFFALSGYLIGGIFWREVRANGVVKLRRFWARRWLRTLPPYYAALALAWTAVLVMRNEPFDFGYLFFAQNYYEVMPFFLVSWSLCIEEHFYFFIPLLYFIIIKVNPDRATLVLWVLIFAPTVFRLMNIQHATSEFSYYTTASHLNSDGLMLGFAVAYLQYYKGWSITPRVRVASLFLLVLVTLLLWSTSVPSLLYVFGRLLVATAFVSLLLIAVGDRRARMFDVGWVRFVAITSYSVYLTHALVIHVVNRFLGPVAITEPFLFFIIEFGAIFLVGFLFYRVFEVWSLVVRDRWVPR